MWLSRPANSSGVEDDEEFDEDEFEYTSTVETVQYILISLGVTFFNALAIIS